MVPGAGQDASRPTVASLPRKMDSFRAEPRGAMVQSARQVSLMYRRHLRVPRVNVSSIGISLSIDRSLVYYHIQSHTHTHTIPCFNHIPSHFISSSTLFALEHVYSVLRSTHTHSQQPAYWRGRTGVQESESCHTMREINCIRK